MTRTNSIRLRLMTLPLLSGLTLLSPLLGEGPRVKKQDPAVYFWYYFRTAVMANQFQKIELLTRFPFERTTAEGATTRLAKGAFREKVIGLLDLSDGAGRTMRALIEQKEDLTPAERAALSGGELTIGLFRFKTIKEKCYWVGSIETESPQAKTSLPGTPLAAKPTMDTATPPVKPTGKPIDENPALASSALQTAETPQSPQEIVDPRTDSVFRFYWIEFRRAALSSDFEKLRSLSRFPFELKGPLEDDKVKKYPAREFDLIWPRLLEADPKSWGPIRDSMRELIERREEPSVEEIATEPSGEIQIGIFVFRKSKNRWRFTRAILAE